MSDGKTMSAAAELVHTHESKASRMASPCGWAPRGVSVARQDTAAGGMGEKWREWEASCTHVDGLRGLHAAQ